MFPSLVRRAACGVLAGRRSAWLRRCRWLLALCVVLAPRLTRAWYEEPGFRPEEWWTGFGGNATAMAWAPDGSNRLFVTLQGGEVWAISRGGSDPSQNAALQFATLRTYDCSECGLLGVAFDPDFQSNGYVYFFVT